MIYLISNVLTLHIIEFIKKDRVVRVIHSCFYIARTTSTKHPVSSSLFSRPSCWPRTSGTVREEDGLKSGWWREETSRARRS